MASGAGRAGNEPRRGHSVAAAARAASTAAWATGSATPIRPSLASGAATRSAAQAAKARSIRPSAARVSDQAAAGRRSAAASGASPSGATATTAVGWCADRGISIRPAASADRGGGQADKRQARPPTRRSAPAGPGRRPGPAPRLASGQQAEGGAPGTSAGSRSSTAAASGARHQTDQRPGHPAGQVGGRPRRPRPRSPSGRSADHAVAPAQRHDRRRWPARARHDERQARRAVGPGRGERDDHGAQRRARQRPAAMPPEPSRSSLARRRCGGSPGGANSTGLSLQRESWASGRSLPASSDSREPARPRRDVRFGDKPWTTPGDTPLPGPPAPPKSAISR